MQRPTSTETEVKRGDGEARAAGGAREEEDRAREENEEGRGMPIYKEKMRTDMRENRGEPNNGYLATQMPRFSGIIKDKTSVGR